MSKSKTALPPPRRQLQLEAEGIKRKIEELKAIKDTKTVTILTQELIKRKDLFRILSGEQYEVPMDISPTEKEGLFRLFSNLNGCSWRNFFGWTGLTQSLTRPQVNVLEGAASLYDGLKLQRVIENLGTLGIIDIEGFGCDGELPRQIGQLRGLKKVNLSMNRIKGVIPSSLSELKKIEVLDLSSNVIDGEVESDWLTEISLHAVVVDLSFNNLSGNLPNAFMKFETLMSLNLSGNSFSGVLPTSFSFMKALKILKMYHNELIGELPDVFSTCTYLIEVNLSQNKFTGDPLRVFARNFHLQKLILNDNLFDTSLHGTFLRKLADLEVLYLQNNRISGGIGLEICSLMNLKMLNMSNNRLGGCLPEEFGNLENLEICILSNNSIIGPVPRSLSKLKKLKDFHIFRQWPCETLYVPREFSAFTHQRLYSDAIALHVDSLCWLSYDEVRQESGTSFDGEKKTNPGKKVKKVRHKSKKK